MGTSCSVETADRNHVEEDTKGLHRHPTKLVKRPHHHHHPAAPITDNNNSGLLRMPSDNLDSDKPESDKSRSKMRESYKYDFVDAQDRVIDERQIAGVQIPATDLAKFKLVDSQGDAQDEYRKIRAKILDREAFLAFDSLPKQRASAREKEADRVLQRVKNEDLEAVYKKAPKRKGYGGQEHPRFFGDRFLGNVPLIEKTGLFNIARAMPKGAHLHIHFNANLLPNVLIDIAKEMEHMYISSDIPLILVGEDPNSREYYRQFDRCKIQFSIRARGTSNDGDLFDPAYQPRQDMSFKEFCQKFQERLQNATAEHDHLGDVDAWLRKKLVFDEEEAHNLLQTADGAWEKFNARTQMMKGLFNYESAYRAYTQLCLQEFVDDNIQYAEIRPNFMPSNYIWTDDGKGRLDNKEIMNLIIEEYGKFKKGMEGENENRSPEEQRYFGGLKVIYCTPRSFRNDLVEQGLRECLEFKKLWPKWIAGFDLVGEESKGKPLEAFLPEFLKFRENCKKENVDIPFLFHCGETLDIGTEVDRNLVDALLLGAKRIGHGVALARHPHIMEQMKKRNVCLELCPISNEILGLTPRVSGHTMYSLLANNVHCTVNTDNGTFFRSRLSHDFYQVFAGKADMNLFGWRQLIEWSLEHSCMEDDLKAQVYQVWEQKWDRFCQWIIDTYGDKPGEPETRTKEAGL